MGIILFIKLFLTKLICLITLKYSWMSPLVVNQLAESPLDYTQILQRPQKTSELSALVRKVLESQESLFTSRDLDSTESLMNSWPKEETSLLETELEENPFME